MALQVWLPLNGDLNNIGINGSTTISGSATFTDNGKLGKCISSSSQITISNTSIANKRIWSFCFWGYIDSSLVTSDWTRIVRACDGNSDLRIEVCPKGGYGNGIYCYCQSNNSSNKIIHSNVTDIVGGHYDQWLHFCMTSDGTTVSVYRNGNLDGTTLYDGDGYLNGIFTLENNDKIRKNDFRIYDHCLSKKEVKEISKGLVCHYTLNDAYLEDTTNLIDVQYKSSGSGGWGGHTSTWTEYDSTNDPIPCNKCTKIAVTYSGSNNGGVGMAVKGISSSASTTYCYSCYVKTPDTLGPLNSNILYRYEYDSNGTKTTEAGCWISSNYRSLGNNWYRVWGTFTTTASTARFDVYSFVYPNKTCDYYIGCWQLELKNHVTPYVFGTRNDNIVYDASGYSNHGTKSGTITCNSDTPRYSVGTYFTGDSSTFITIPAMILDMTNITFSIWAKWSSFNTWSRVFDFGEKTSGSGYAFLVANNASSALTVAGRLSGGASLPDTTIQNISLNTWYHIVVTLSGTECKTYLNGTLVKTFNLNGLMSTATPFNLNYLGKSNWSADKFFAGILSDFRIYAAALSADDILELYNASINFNKHSLMSQGEFLEK